MLDAIRLTVAIMFGLSLIIVLMDMYHVAKGIRIDSERWALK